jgi:hypothetical protein
MGSIGMMCDVLVPCVGIVGDSGLALSGGIGSTLVLRMPVRGHFIRPLDVAGLGVEYLRIKSGFIKGTPNRWPLLIALINVCNGGLKNAWCMYFSCCCLKGRVYTL